MRPISCVPIAAGALGLAALLFAEATGRPRLRAAAKATCSAGFVALALTLGLRTPWARTLFAGLLLAAVGDLLLLSRRDRPFLAGLVAFLACQVAYAVAFARVASPSAWTGAGLILLGALILRWLWPHLGPMRGAVAVYCAVISAMLWLATGLGRPAVTAGALLFYVSDVFVARDRFVRPGLRNQLVIHPLYFVGQYLIASSVG